MAHLSFTNTKQQFSWKISFFLCIISLLCISSQALASNKIIKGKIIDSQKEILEGANLIVLGEDNHAICFAIADGNGTFTLECPDSITPKEVKVRYLGYEPLTIPFNELKDGMVITMKTGKFQLKEVKVKASKIRSMGDTLSYSVNAFKQGQDRSIADVIKKMPGLEVSDNGSVSYQGLPINKFYIEGLDLMGSQYGVANKNISADKIKSVQVLQNHQPVKSLRGISFSDQAALNLVLKDTSKDVWTGTADIGLGYGKDFLYDGRIMGMQFNKSKQTLVMYKTNNTGKNISNEISRFSGMSTMLTDPNSMENGVLSLLSIGNANVDRQRYTFNHSHLLAGNWLLKLNNTQELRFQANGLIDKTNMQYYHSTTYLNLPDMPIIVEEESAHNYKSQWKGEINYQSNGTHTFIKNNLQGNFNFDKSIGTTLINNSQTDMRVRPRRQHLSDNFQLSHTTHKGNVYEIQGLASYLNLPGELLTINNLTEKLDFKFFSAAGSLKYKQKIGKQYLNNEFGASYDNQRIGVNGLPPISDLSTEDYKKTNGYQQSTAYWMPSLSLTFGSQRLNTSAKLKYLHQTYQDSKATHFFIEPRLSWSWDYSAKSKVTASATLNHTPLNGMEIFEAPIFTSYRNMKENRGEVATQKQGAFTIGYQYTDPIQRLFLNIRPFYNIKTGNILYESSMENDIYMMKASDKNYTNRSLGARGNIAKSFSWASLYIGLSGSYIKNQYKLLINEQIDDAQMISSSLKLDYSLQPLNILTIEGASTWKSSQQENKTEPERYKTRKVSSWEHELTFNLLPNDRWIVSLSNELYHSKGNNLGVNYFCDFSVCYKSKRWELSLITNNIFDTSKFKRQTLSNTVMAYSITTLRPRECMIKYSLDL